MLEMLLKRKRGGQKLSRKIEKLPVFFFFSGSFIQTIINFLFFFFTFAKTQMEKDGTLHFLFSFFAQFFFFFSFSYLLDGNDNIPLVSAFLFCHCQTFFFLNLNSERTSTVGICSFLKECFPYFCQ